MCTERAHTGPKPATLAVVSSHVNSYRETLCVRVMRTSLVTTCDVTEHAFRKAFTCWA